jgi:hypothetical protein
VTPNARDAFKSTIENGHHVPSTTQNCEGARRLIYVPEGWIASFFLPARRKIKDSRPAAFAIERTYSLVPPSSECSC